MAQNKPEPSFNAPVPGMSLTTEPGNRPWEQPPKYSDVEDVIEFYLGRFEDDKKVERILYYIENGVPVNSMVQTVLTNGAMNGIHTIESGLLAGPVISEYIQAVAEIEGIDFVVSSEEYKNNTMSKEDAKTMALKLKRQLSENYGTDDESTMLSSEEDSGESISGGGMGLMSRRQPQAEPVDQEDMDSSEVLS